MEASYEKRQFFPNNLKKVSERIFVIKCLCLWQREYIGEYGSYWPSPLPTLLRRFHSHAHRCVFWKPASLSPLQMKSLNAKTDRLTLEATASLFKCRTQLHSFPLHHGRHEWSPACFTALSTARQWCESATAIHSPGRLVLVCSLFSSACGRCLTLATDISCPGTHQVQDIKQHQQQQPLCLKPSRDHDTTLCLPIGWRRAMTFCQPLTWVNAKEERGSVFLLYQSLWHSKLFRSDLQSLLFWMPKMSVPQPDDNRN